MSAPRRRSFSEVKANESYSPVLPAVAEMLLRECEANDAAKEPPIPCELVFQSDRLAKVSIHDFLVRMCKYGRCSPGIFVCMAIYLDKLMRKTGLMLNSHNAHQVCLAAFVIAAKLNDDVYYSNHYYASIGTFSLEYMNKLEQHFLTLVDWDVYVKPSLFDSYHEHLAGRTGSPTARQSPLELKKNRSGLSSPESSMSSSMESSSGSPALALRHRRKTEGAKVDNTAIVAAPRRMPA